MPRRVSCREATARYIDAFKGQPEHAGQNIIPAPDCSWEATGGTDDEVLDSLDEHVRGHHRLEPKDAPSGVRERIRQLITSI